MFLFNIMLILIRKVYKHFFTTQYFIYSAKDGLIKELKPINSCFYQSLKVIHRIKTINI
jgi:hypothetical protein